MTKFPLRPRSIPLASARAGQAFCTTPPIASSFFSKDARFRTKFPSSTLPSSARITSVNLYRAARCCMTLSSNAPPADEAPSSSSPSTTGGEAGMMPRLEDFPGRKCGFAGLLGPSNSGKSTLLNLLVGSKVAIVTPKVQTTRCRVAGIVTKEDTMVVYLDTPGVFKPNGRLDRAMVRAAWSAARAGDVVAVIVDAAQMFHGGKRAGEEYREWEHLYVSEALQEIFGRMPNNYSEYCVCLNKMDAIPGASTADFLERMSRVLQKLVAGSSVPIPAVFPISAKTGDGVEKFCAWIEDHMPGGPWLYPEDDLTDMPLRLLAAEITREKLFMLLKQELPYETAVETTSYQEKKDGSVRISQNVLVNRESQKGIVTGRGGTMIKAIGVAARKELLEVMGNPVHLMLTVKVREKWKDDRRAYSTWGLEYDA